MNQIGESAGVNSIKRWARLFDHTVLKPEAQEKDIKELVLEACHWGAWSVCLNPVWLSLAADCLKEWADCHPDEAKTHVPRVCSVVGFPSGAHQTEVKVAETRACLRAGAQEIDWVISVGSYLTSTVESRSQVKRELFEITSLAHESGALAKVILETGYLNPDQIRELCEWSVAAGADFVKTSTGFGPRGASVGDIELMKSLVQDSRTKVKASGGIRDLKTVRTLIGAGADRIGSSQTVAILTELYLGKSI